ncbi:hypothetical protein B0A48_00824 [Cryoendolithus antarcticus]|uniref:Uncharacterized protein n=1 Tax=Cryoendolithus antarcticus TaxID=1507870 RepID=A0A1V8TRF6_9PEZI|nr:hypothetical protein B0A48_00824 [Cryoendolithus antarcticus]
MVEVASRLRAILTPKLLSSIYHLSIPAPGSTPETLFARFYGDTDTTLTQSLYDLTFHKIFVPLSHIPSATWPSDLLSLLPNPAHEDFLIQALALVLLLDQVPRLILKCHDTRWAYGFFGPLACRLAQQLDGLPPHLRADDMERWLALGSGLSWADVMLRCSLHLLPFVHAEDSATQSRAQGLNEATRQSVESHFHLTDPSRHDPRADVSHPASLPRLVAGPIPPSYYVGKGYDVFFFFDYQIDRAHVGVLEKFGRFPWRNAPLGRDDTGEEVGYLESIGGFAQMDGRVTGEIREDVRKGIWRPLRGWVEEAEYAA